MDKSVFSNGRSYSDMHIGNPYLFYIIPFSIKHPSPKKARGNIEGLVAASDIILDVYSSNSPHPRTEIMSLISLVDEEVYSDFYRKEQHFYRFFLGSWRSSFKTVELPVDIIITFHAGGWGTALFLSTFEKPISYMDFLNLLNRIQACSDPKLVAEDASIKSFSLSALIVHCYNELYGKKKYFFSKKESRECLLGENYPFIVIHSNSLKIRNVKDFIHNNALNIYGLANIDFWGWRRTRTKEALNLMDVDLSRREEYSFFITPQASLEIDSLTRVEQIQRWAVETKTTPFLTHMKLLFERVLDLETLRAQHHIMTTLDLQISNVIAARKVSHNTLGHLRTQIASGLNDFYNIKSQNKGHVSGTVWITYGQERMGINRLFSSLKERIESLEMSYDVHIKSANYQVTAILSLISVLLSAAASGQVINMLFDIPILKTSIFNEWKWLASIVLFVVLFFFITMSFMRAVRAAKQ